MKFLIKNLLCVFALTLLFTTTACNKDALYNITTIDSTLLNKNDLASIAFVSDSYSSGIPTFSGPDQLYSYSGIAIGGTQLVENIFTSSSSGLPTMKFRLNPSNVETDSIKWSIIRRETQLTKTVEGDQLFAGEFSVKRSSTHLGELTITVTQDDSKFFQAHKYLYALVANLATDKQIVSDMGCYLTSSESSYKKLSNVFLGFEIDDKIIPSNELNLALTQKPTFLPVPTPYGIYNDQVYSFEELGISASDYIVDIKANNQELAGGITATEKLDDNSNLLGWNINPYGEFKELDFEDFNSKLIFSSKLYNADKSALVESTLPQVHSQMQDMVVETTEDTDINSNPIYANSTATITGYDLRDFTVRNYGFGTNSLDTDYTKIEYFIDNNEVSSSDLTIATYRTESNYLAYNVVIKKQLSKGDHTLKIEFSNPNKTAPKFIHIIGVKVAAVPEINYPELVNQTFNTYGNFVNNKFEMTANLSDLYSVDIDNSKPTDGYTFVLSFVKELSGKFIIDGELKDEIRGDFKDLESILSSARVGLSSDLISDISRIEVVLETYYQTNKLNSLISTVGFKNPFFIDGKPSYTIQPTIGSVCNMTEDLTVTFEADDNSSTLIYANGVALQTKYGEIEPEFTNSGLISEVDMSVDGVVVVQSSVEGKENVGNMTITFRTEGENFVAIKTMKPTITVKHQ